MTNRSPARAGKQSKKQITGRERFGASDKPSLAAPTAPSLDLTPTNVAKLQPVIGNQGVRALLAREQADVDAEQRAMERRVAGPTITATPARPVIHRFGSKEHQELGDQGSGGQAYHFGPAGVRPANFVEAHPFRLTHGDITMLSGDLFDPRDTITDEAGNQQPNPDSLFRLAQTPSSDPGRMPGTQDEVLYAIKKGNAGDPRFAKSTSPDQPGGEWADIEFSAAVMQAVDSRYLRLAAVNREHFASPTGHEGGPASGLGASAGGSYRALHEDAVLRAFSAGQGRGELAEAMAREAAADHFLTDNFAAGHLRTPRESIRTYWHDKYPLFFGNMKKKIALDVARYMNDDVTNLATILGTVSAIYDKIIKEVEEKTAGMPAVGFDDLVGMVAHDEDNKTGLWVVNDLGDRWKDFGDSNLHKPDPDNRTAEMAELAVKLSVDDIQHAFNLGKSHPGPIANEFIFDSVKSQASSPAVAGVKYGPEQIIPRVDEAAGNGAQTWQADSFDALWGTAVRSDSSTTYGSAISASLQSGDIRETLDGMAEKFPENQEVYTVDGPSDNPWVRPEIKNLQKVMQEASSIGTLHPRKAFLNGFLQPLLDNPQVGLRSIIDFNPSEGQAFFNEDDAVMEEAGKMGDDEFKGFTVNQRADRVRSLVVGTLNYVGHDEGEMVIKLFQTAEPGERAELYRLVEGRAWTGHWIEGFWIDDDEIYNGLDGDQLGRLQKLINGK